MHRLPSSLMRLLVALVVLSLAGPALGGPPSRAYADSRTYTLFRAEFENAPVGPLSGPLDASPGTVVPSEGKVAIAQANSRALALDGTGGQATALLQWQNYPGALPISTTQELRLRVSADFTTTNSNSGASFGLISSEPMSGTTPITGTNPISGSTDFFEFFTFAPSGAVTRDGKPTGLTYTAGTKLRLDVQITLKNGTGSAKITLNGTGGKRTLTVTLPGTFTLATLNQLRFQLPSGGGVTTVDKVLVQLQQKEREPAAVIVIRDGDIEQEIERIDGVVFVSIKITIVNTGGTARGTFLVLDLDDFAELFDLADVSFLENVGFVQRIEGGKVYIGLGQNNIIGANERLKVKIKFKAKQLRADVKINARFQLQFSDSGGDQTVVVSPVVVVVPVVPVVVTPVIVQRLPVSAIDIRFKRTWETRGGLLIFGLPLTGPITQTNGLIIQYFERARLEYHPDQLGTPYVVQLGRLAVELGYTTTPTSTTAPTRTADLVWYFPATGHLIAQPFRTFWKARGGLAIFGLPISGVIVEDGRQVQYFERARFELHPENADTPYEVQLGLLGVRALERQQQQR